MNFLRKIFSNSKFQGAFYFSIAIITLAILVSYHPSDPSLNLVTDKAPENVFGFLGSYSADILYQLLGLSAFIIPICCFSWAHLLFKQGYVNWFGLKILSTLISSILFGILLAKISFNTFLPAGLGGVSGKLLAAMISNTELNIAIFALAIVFLFVALGLSVNSYKILTQRIIARTKTVPINFQVKYEPLNKSKSLRTAPSLASTEQFPISEPSPTSRQKISSKPASNIQNQYSALPPIELLKKTENQNIKAESQAELRQNAENLLAVLGDFGVKGQMIDVSCGPVVTLYEFEPAAGTKSSRVIGLSDDIARSLSAVSTRIAVVPGRNVLGIELPNKQRAFFCLRELIETPEYQNPNLGLPLILGKDLAGRPYVADLAKMPHLLVAGTTGSGKSVAINTMIMSLLYRYTPQECRLIMIDPKMLELSAYDGIPHLLTPVVTEPCKAIVALKWAVKEMENRYRLMSNVGVRNIAGYNAKIDETANQGKILERTVQTGFDPETGKPIYESVPINMEKLPFIVVIVDEMADLMLVAGKDIESSIQRLAQMARAAGIHIIMATQRPSVDVITGVIKANFPSRISFKVTSKIDSRTILGEQGAEQLLGMGDMLYMGNSSMITRVHGPFVDDIEVEKVTEYLKTTGEPEYISAVTETLEESVEEFGIEEGGEDDSSLYRKALQIIKQDRKVSISYIQRCLRIGYNRAAIIIERMEKEGVISPASATGKREILLPED